MAYSDGIIFNFDTMDLKDNNQCQWRPVFVSGGRPKLSINIQIVSESGNRVNIILQEINYLDQSGIGR